MVPINEHWHRRQLPNWLFHNAVPAKYIFKGRTKKFLSLWVISNIENKKDFETVKATMFYSTETVDYLSLDR